MTTIIFTNEYNEQISQQQLSQLSEFNKVYQVDGLTKKIEFYVDGLLDGIEFHKDNENLNEIFSILGTNTVDVVEKVTVDNYLILIWTVYKDGILRSIRKELLLDNKVICNQELDVNNVPINQYTKKYIYDDTGFERGEEIFNFNYNSDGSLDYICGVGYPFSEYNQSLDASEISLYFPDLLTENPYYANANFMP
jgi:hypothetical protein